MSATRYNHTPVPPASDSRSFVAAARGGFEARTRDAADAVIPPAIIRSALVDAAKRPYETAPISEIRRVAHRRKLPSVLTAGVLAIFRAIAGIVTHHFDFFVCGLMVDVQMATPCDAATTLIFRDLLWRTRMTNPCPMLGLISADGRALQPLRARCLQDVLLLTFKVEGRPAPAGETEGGDLWG